MTIIRAIVEEQARLASLAERYPDTSGLAEEILKRESILEAFRLFMTSAHPTLPTPDQWTGNHLKLYARIVGPCAKSSDLRELAHALTLLARLQGRNETYENPCPGKSEATTIWEVIRDHPFTSFERGVLVDFARFIGLPGIRRAVDELNTSHFEQYLRARLRRGESVEGFRAARQAFFTFSALIRRSREYEAAERRFLTTLRLSRRGAIWVVEPHFPPGERKIVEAGLPRHGETTCTKECSACAAGIPQGSWWTPDVRRVSRLRFYTDGATYGVFLREERRTREESLKLSSAREAVLDIPAPPAREYLPFQKAGIAYALSRRATLLGDEMGLGKTIQALGVVNGDPSINRVLVVSPATALANWRREAESWLVRAFKMHICETNTAPPEDAGMVMVSYGRLAGPLRPHLVERSWDLLIADEAHYVKNVGARRTRALFGTRFEPGLLKQARRVMFLTGTPILNDISELLTLVRALDPVAFAPERIPQSFDALQRLLRETVLVRRLKSEVLPELSPKRWNVVILPRNIAESAVAEERRVLMHYVSEIRSLEEALAASAKNSSARKEAARRLSQARIEAQGGIFRARHLVALAKLPAVLDYCDTLLATGAPKLVIWAHHLDVIESISGHYQGRSVTVIGEVPPPDRVPLVDRFQTDPACQVFVGSLRASGTAITLTAADQVVFAELDWTPATLTQAEDRCHRIGQRGGLLIHHLVVENSIDAHLAQTIVEKQRLIRAALDSPGADDDDAGLDLALQAA